MSSLSGGYTIEEQLEDAEQKVLDLEIRLKEAEACIIKAFNYLKVNHECEAYNTLATYEENKWLDKWSNLESKTTLEDNGNTTTYELIDDIWWSSDELMRMSQEERSN